MLLYLKESISGATGRARTIVWTADGRRRAINIMQTLEKRKTGVLRAVADGQGLPFQLQRTTGNMRIKYPL